MIYIVLGSGGRENIILRKLKEDIENILMCISNFINPEIQNNVKNYYILDNLYLPSVVLQKINEIILYNNIDLGKIIVVPGSENFLENGLVDLLLENKINCIAPPQSLANIETSKLFCRDFLNYNNLGVYQPKYQVIHNYDEESIKLLFLKYGFNFVLKKDGLCGGKGVSVYDSNNYLEALDVCKKYLKNNNKILIEERLYGREFSLMSFCDGKNIKHMPLCQDYKDVSKNSTEKTGGMGAVVLNNHSFPFLSDKDVLQAQELNKKTMELLSNRHSYGYKGILYGGFMKTENGIKLIEYNARFGDPESINVLNLLESSLGDIFKAIINQSLNEVEINFENKYCLTKYIVPNGYPSTPMRNKTIHITKKINTENLLLANIYNNFSGLLSLGGSRAICLIEKNVEFNNCFHTINKLCGNIQGPIFYREDLGEEYLDINSVSKIINESNSIDENKKKNDLYSSSGVNIEEGENVVNKIMSSVIETHNKYIHNNYGDFGGIFNLGEYLRDNSFNDPVLLSSTDGVGTKTLFVLEHLGLREGLRSLGKDIVGHSVNDILVKGATPLYLLDYIASSKIVSDNIQFFVEGLAEACVENGVSILGGETAEMPDVYKHNSYDIVGTIVGICDRENLIDGKRDIKEGNIVVGLRSSGPHTNGYSLVRKIIEENGSDKFDIQLLTNPHKSYLKEYNELKSLGIKINGMCHITGGGFEGNLKRVLPDDLGVNLGLMICEPFSKLRNLGNISNEEMYNVFNCGFGMLIFMNENDYDKIIYNPDFIYLGEVKKRDHTKRINIENKFK
jgi:phosphoribosylamine--glycine ligase/phosphoribosylaminoimidazole synthetase